ncbi:response regulator [Mucilaginibacter ginkgonis]|uniref:histidine kinase n=1 Tax=Mucilaginibacter ginkgonis TaxID=2682091 RepID=A0A6I4HV39_9SPHI|nr:response regulator [Mucilaginibacter ginkgonis]QQL49953.1 response regulator [Mucilaginibacter ginkgonis]
MNVINVVIVDDKADNVEMLAEALEREDISIFATTSSNDALSLCRNNKIDIAFIDINMPDLSGLQLLKLLQDSPATSQIMVVLITGYSSKSEDVVHGLLSGAVDYLIKPLDLHVITAKINSLIKLVVYQREINKKNEELKHYQEELIKTVEVSNKSKLVKENFLAKMSHEIRTPLNAIMGLTYVLKNMSLNDEQKGLVNLLEYSSNSLLGIVNDILEISKIDAGHVKINRIEIEITRLIDNICESTRPMALSKGLQLICEIDENVPKLIIADGLRLNQILINLINNAIKFTEKGIVKLGVKLTEKMDNKCFLTFAISDTGVGIPKEKLGTIFSRFEQIENNVKENFGGTGLGLAIVKKLAELKGGNIAVESKLGQGSTFTFSNWYVNTNNKLNSELNQIFQLNPLENIRILVVDDNAVNRIVTQKILSGWKISVDTADDGFMALDKLREYSYDLILMDIHMPKMNGLETTAIIRNEFPDNKKNVPIISYSSSVVESELQQAKEAGVNEFVLKPFLPEVLHKKISNLITSVP